MAQELCADDLPDVVKLVGGPGGLPVLQIRSDLAEADIFLHGAQLTHWKPRGSEPVIFLSEKSLFEEGKAIRGGVPICFPWFGPKPGDGAHGFVRNQTWALDEVALQENGEVRATLSVTSSAESEKRWPHSFRAQMIYTVGETLEMTLDVENTGTDAFTYSEALHTYFVVGDVHQTRVTGLENSDYRDFPDRTKITRQRGPITFTEETDRVYINTGATCVLEDPSMNRRIIVEKNGSNGTTVWNPWIAKSAALPDFGDDEWKRMVCIETVNAFENSITVSPREHHATTARISVRALV